MYRFCLLLGLAAPIWATPITGTFDFSANSNFADIIGDGFAWQFHQGNSGAIFASCMGDNCSLDGSAAPAMFALLKPENWFRASEGTAEVQGNLKPGEFTGGIGGSFSWHVARTDWSDVPIGGPVPVVVPMQIAGLLTATDAQGRTFMEKVLSGTGNFETSVIRDEHGVTFFGASGRFDGTVASKNASAPGGTNGPPVGPAGPGDDRGGAVGGFVSGPGAAAGTGGGSCTGAGETGSGSDASPVPEPATWLLLGAGIASLTALRRRFA